MTLTHGARKEKAKRLQRWVARKIADLTGLTVEKDGDIESRQMGQTGADVRLSLKARERFPFSVECKNQETFSIPSWIKQAEANVYPATEWLLIVSKNHWRPIAILDAESFFKLLDKIPKRWRTR